MPPALFHTSLPFFTSPGCGGRRELGSFDRCSSPLCECLCTHVRRTCSGMFPRCCRRTVRGCGRSGCACMCSEEASASLWTAVRSGRSRTVRGFRPRKAHACPCTGRSDDGCRCSGEASPHPDIPVRSICSIRSCHLPFVKVFVLYHIVMMLCELSFHGNLNLATSVPIRKDRETQCFPAFRHSEFYQPVRI